MSVSTEVDNAVTRIRRNGLGSERYRQIVAAAYEILEAEGLDGLTIRAVLKHTGLARRAFYECFAGKDDLVLAVFEQTLRAAAIYFAEEAERLASPLEAVRFIVAGIVLGRLAPEGGQWEANDRLSAALSREHLRLAQSRPDELQAALRPLLELIARQVSEGIRLKQFRECDPHLQATLIYNLVATTVHTELLTQQGGRPDRKRREKLTEVLWEFCRRAIID